MLVRDNLKTRTMAQYKAIQDGQIQLYQDIENQLVDLAFCKGKAFSDSSMEEKERSIESSLDERGLNNPNFNFGRQSTNSELLQSVKSSEDFFEDLSHRFKKNNANNVNNKNRARS